MGAADAGKIVTVVGEYVRTGTGRDVVAASLKEQGVPAAVFLVMTRVHGVRSGGWVAILTEPWETIEGARVEEWRAVPDHRLVAVYGRRSDGSVYFCQSKDPFFWDPRVGHPRDGTWGLGETDGVPEWCRSDESLIKIGKWCADQEMRWVRLLAAVWASRADLLTND